MLGYRLTTKKRDAINKQLETLRAQRLQNSSSEEESTPQTPDGMPDIKVATPEISDNSIEKGSDVTTQAMNKEYAEEYAEKDSPPKE